MIAKVKGFIRWITKPSNDKATLNSCIDFYKDKKRKYEFRLFEGNMTMVNRETPIMQSEGWELAGDISTRIEDNGGNRMLIPFKRKIK